MLSARITLPHFSVSAAINTRKSGLGTFRLVGLSDIVLRMWGGVANDPVLASIPMFIFMGAILERSGSALSDISRRRSNSVAFGAKRTLSGSRCAPKL